jgi:hypothetical protein
VVQNNQPNLRKGTKADARVLGDIDGLSRNQRLALIMLKILSAALNKIRNCSIQWIVEFRGFYL